MSRQSRPIVCGCEHPVHFEKDVSKLPGGRYGENHPAGARCTYVVRADVGGALICGGCWKAGHGAVRHPDAFERFHAKEHPTPKPMAISPCPLVANALAAAKEVRS
jgi:hypothetical protein